jgi:K+-transporting ATPase ATPase C chain
MMLLIMTLLLGIIYPALITAAAQVTFPDQADGSIVRRDGMILGSKLLGQANNDPRYFWPRPSATAYNALPSGASNEGPASEALAGLVRQREAEFRAKHGLEDRIVVPVEMLFASGSGLDPHISPQAARLQVDRVARARGIETAVVSALLEDHVERPQLGFLGQPRVNVLLLNLALDELEYGYGS